MAKKGWGERIERRDAIGSIARVLEGETDIGRYGTGSYVTRRIEKLEILITRFASNPEKDLALFFSSSSLSL